MDRLRGTVALVTRDASGLTEAVAEALGAEAVVRTLALWVSVTAPHFADVPVAHRALRAVETLFDRAALGPLELPEAAARLDPVSTPQLRGHGGQAVRGGTGAGGAGVSSAKA